MDCRPLLHLPWGGGGVASGADRGCGTVPHLLHHHHAVVAVSTLVPLARSAVGAGVPTGVAIAIVSDDHYTPV